MSVSANLSNITALISQLPYQQLSQLVTGIILAVFFYAGQTDRAAAMSRLLGRVHTLIKQKFYIDEIYLFVTHQIIFRFISRPADWFDRNVVDGGVNLSAWITRTTGWELRCLQTGQVQVYGLWFVARDAISAFDNLGGYEDNQEKMLEWD